MTRVLSAKHKAAMLAGRRRAIRERPQRRERRLQEVDRRLIDLGAEYDRMREAGDPARVHLRDEMRELAHEWTAIRAEILRDVA